MSTIYEMTQDWMVLMEMAEDPECDQEAIKDTMESLEYEIEAKADGYAKVMVELNARKDALKAQIDRLTERTRTIDNNIQRMKEALQGAMEATGKTKFKTQLFSFGIQKNPPSLVIEEGATVPEEYLIPQEPKVDRKKIVEMLKSGETLHGMHLEQRESLRIR